jgi:hypothetical protein
LRDNLNVKYLLPFLWIAAAQGANWQEYRSGPFRVVSDAGDKIARERLTEMEQIRYVLGSWIGKDGGKVELSSVWPITLVLFQNTKQYAPNAAPAPFVEGGSAMLSAWTAETPQPLDWKRELVRRLMEDNAGRMPEPIETGLTDLLSTIQVNVTRLTLGTPPPQERRSRGWAKVHYLATAPELAGRFRVYLNNLQQGGDEALAARNALNLDPADLEKRVDEYVRAGKFETVPVPGKPIAPGRDFIEKQVADSAIQELLAELKAAGKSFPPDSPRGLVAKNTRPALELAATANPKWAEPHFLLGSMETNPVAKVKELKAAAALAPRNAAYWQALAEAQAVAGQYGDASRSWASAERAAANGAEREKIRITRRELEERRTGFELAERRRQADERAQELERLKQAAAAEIHAAEDAANRAQGGLKSNVKPVEWWTDAKGEPVSGTLTRVDCLTGLLKLTIAKAGGGNAVLLVRDPQKIAVRGAQQASFACGVQRPPRKIAVEHNAKPDPALGTAGDVVAVEFP